jgi:mono/diheme cytochrome c family protein
MPRLFAGDPYREKKVEALVHFLASTGSLRHEPPNLKALAPGKELYHRVGCVACHGTRDQLGQAEKLLPASVPLGDLHAKYSVFSLAAFLDNPLHVRPSGRMPRLVTGKDAKDIASYLLQGLKVDLASIKGAAKYAYYEGTWDKLPDFSKLKAQATGIGAAFDLGPARRGNDYAMTFSGYFKLDRDGAYTFFLHSDDGSKLFLDGQQAIDNDGVHAPRAVSSTVKLAKGIHKVAVQFFQVGGGAELDVQVAGPRLPQQPLAALVGVSEAAVDKPPAPPKPDDEDYLALQPALVEKGKTLFVSSGCANCHSMQGDQKLLVSTLKAPALENIQAAGGCLTGSPAVGLPRFSLIRAQAEVLSAVLRRPLHPNKEPRDVISQTLLAFNCYACHSRDKQGGPDEALDRFFQSKEPEMGDEGRVPPPLDGVGAKLNADYLRQILDQGSHDRPYMYTRMPGFGAANIGPLVQALAELDTMPPAERVAFSDSSAKVKAAGRHLVGSQALGCIKCHTFAGQRAEGVQGIDMLLMPRRVRRDWFHAYLIDPARLRPGTRMPTAWPDGKTLLPEVLGGKTYSQVEAIWVYLQDGGSAQLPVGLQRHSIPLVPGKGAIIYRNFIHGAGTRAIGVGYPEKVNLAFDANDLRLALLWQGAFIDAARHWTDRGSGWEGPLGDNVLTLPAGPSFARLEKVDSAWPAKASREAGYRFLGYHLTADDRPTFLYSVAEIHVEDFPVAVAGQEGTLRRSLILTSVKPIDSLVFRAAVGNKIESLAGGWYRIDGWKLRLANGLAPWIRSSAGKSELLLPVTFKDRKAQVSLEYVW